MSLRYSAVIRTTGLSNLLLRTLESLEIQTILPDEILIILPEGEESWDTNNDKVRFTYSKRGMISQRAKGIAAAKNNYALLLDDDILLAPDAAEVLFGSLLKNHADCVVPYWAEGWPTGFKRWICAFWGIAVPRRGGGIKYTAGGGFYYPLTEPGAEAWETLGGAGAVIALNRDFALKKQVLGDMHLQKVKYALRDDGAFILALAKSGGKCLMVGGAKFIHLGVNRASGNNIGYRYEAGVFNQYIFWNKYIFCDYKHSVGGRFKTTVAFLWYLLGICFLGAISSIKHLSLEPMRGIVRGFNLINSANSKVNQ
jgi:glycosyltransferase involved in cell wall biosynthesis